MEKIVCPACGRINNKKNIACSGCGELLNSTDTIHQSYHLYGPKDHYRNKITAFFVVFFSLVALLVVGFVFWFFYQDLDNHSFIEFIFFFLFCLLGGAYAIKKMMVGVISLMK